MDRSRLRRLLKLEEGPKLDFKAELHLGTESEKKELAKDVIAIANSRGGRGYIIFGVEDKTKRILGIDPSCLSEEQIQQVIYNRCDPPVSVSVDFIEEGGLVIAVLTIYTSAHKPHQMLQNGAFYVRRGSTTDIARRSEIANLFQENGILTYETVVLRHADMEQFDRDMLKSYFSTLDVVSDSPSEVILEAMGIIGRDSMDDCYHPTIGGILLFGSRPQIFLPHAYIAVNMEGQSRIIYGNITAMLDEASAYIRQLLKQDDYPYDALDEALANAVIHRDYLDTGRGITVDIGERGIEIINPGSMVATGSGSFRAVGGSNPGRRNPWLYQRMMSFDRGRKYTGTTIGMARMKNAFPGYKEPRFINIVSQNLFKAVFPRWKKQQHIQHLS